MIYEQRHHKSLYGVTLAQSQHRSLAAKTKQYKLWSIGWSQSWEKHVLITTGRVNSNGLQPSDINFMICRYSTLSRPAEIGNSRAKTTGSHGALCRNFSSPVSATDLVKG